MRDQPSLGATSQSLAIFLSCWSHRWDPHVCPDTDLRVIWEARVEAGGRSHSRAAEERPIWYGEAGLCLVFAYLGASRLPILAWPPARGAIPKFFRRRSLPHKGVGMHKNVRVRPLLPVGRCFGACAPQRGDSLVGSGWPARAGHPNSFG